MTIKKKKTATPKLHFSETAFEISDFVCLKILNSNELTSFVLIIMFSVKEGKSNFFQREIWGTFLHVSSSTRAGLRQL